MRGLIFVWAAVEVLQVVAIAVLVIGYRDLQKRLRQTSRFEEGPPPSVVED